MAAFLKDLAAVLERHQAEICIDQESHNWHTDHHLSVELKGHDGAHGDCHRWEERRLADPCDHNDITKALENPNA